MRRLSTLLSKPFLCYKCEYRFAKIIKLTPLVQTNNYTSQSIRRSIKITKQLMQDFIPINKQVKDRIYRLKQQQSAQSLIQYINEINQALSEQKIIFTRDSLYAQKILTRMKKQKIIYHMIQMLINRQQFTKKQRKCMTLFFLCVSKLFKKSILQLKKNTFDRDYFKQFMDLFNQYIILLQMSDKLLINYLFLVNYLISHKMVDSTRTYFANQKIVIDYLLQNKNTVYISQKQMANVMSNYPQRYLQFVQLLLSKIDYDWDKDIKDQKRNAMLLYGLNYNSKKITRGLKTLMNLSINQNNYQTIVLAFNCYLNLNAQLFHNKPVNQQYINVLRKLSMFIKQYKIKSKQIKHMNITSSSNNQQKKQQLSNKNKYNKPFRYDKSEDFECYIYRTIMTTLFRSSIWYEQIWILFAQWLDTNKNYQKIPIINLYTIFDLLKIDKDIIPQTIINRLLLSKNNLLIKNNLKIQDVDLIKLYHTQYGDRMKASYTVQQSLANNLRSVSSKSIKTQSLIHFFIVDIVMNDNVIIQVNNQLHYIENENKDIKKINIKSGFRKRILQKLGYKFVQIQVQNVTQGNYQCLKIMNQSFNLLQQNINKSI